MKLRYSSVFLMSISSPAAAGLGKRKRWNDSTKENVVKHTSSTHCFVNICEEDAVHT